MGNFLLVIHIVICVFLILLIMAQKSKGSDLGAGLSGGNADSVFGSKGGKSTVNRLTVYIAIAFFFTCLSLGTLSVREYKSNQVAVETTK